VGSYTLDAGSRDEVPMQTTRPFVRGVVVLAAGIAGTLFISTLSHAQTTHPERAEQLSLIQNSQATATSRSKQPQNAAPLAGTLPAVFTPPRDRAPSQTAFPKGADSAIRTAVKRLVPSSLLDRRKYGRALATFPSFCRDWERKLHDREVNNLANITWQERNGYKTATYTGYGKIEHCECKPTPQGIPIGKLTYREMSYYLVGKTIEEAKHAAPKLLRRTDTLEIFSWEKNKWFY